jgi:hypothetical protein
MAIGQAHRDLIAPTSVLSSPRPPEPIDSIAPISLSASTNDMNRFASIIFTLIFATTTANAAINARIRTIVDARTLQVESGGKLQEVHLYGVSIVDEAGALAWLHGSVERASVFVDWRGAPGEALVYRSPDALFVNAELVRAGFANATAQDIVPRPRVAMTYIGELIDLGATKGTTKRGDAAQPATRASKSTSTSKRGTGPIPPSGGVKPRTRRATAGGH